MADQKAADSKPTLERGSGMVVQVTFDYREYSYVVMMGAPGGTFNLTGQQLVNVFGKYGKGNVIQQPNLLGVVLGDSNQLIMQPPKMTFKGATEEILEILYGNARPLVLRPFASHPATAFGVNFVVEVECQNIRPSEFLTRIFSEKISEWITLRSATIEREKSLYTLSVSKDNIERLHISVNNHIDKPLMPSFDSEQLKEQINNYKRINEGTIKEIYECVHKIHS